MTCVSNESRGDHAWLDAIWRRQRGSSPHALRWLACTMFRIYRMVRSCVLHSLKIYIIFI